MISGPPIDFVRCPVCLGSGRLYVPRERFENVAHIHTVTLERVRMFLSAQTYRNDLQAWDFGECMLCDGAGGVVSALSSAYRLMRGDGNLRYFACTELRKQMRDIFNDKKRDVTYTPALAVIYNLVWA